jgi:hypothetical protein
MRQATIALLLCLVVSGCREAEVTSTPYTREDGTVAFSIERYTHGFNLKAMDSSGRPSLTLLKVGMCRSGRVVWDGKKSVVFVHEGVEMHYLADGFDESAQISISVCRSGVRGCDAQVDGQRKVIEVSCG